MSLNYFISKKIDETFIIGFIGNTPAELNSTNPKLKLSVNQPLSGITNIISYTDDVQSTNGKLYLKKYFKYKNFETWSDLLPIEQISGMTFNQCNPLDLEFHYILVQDGNVTGSVYLNNIQLNGQYKLTDFDSEVIIRELDGQAKLSPKDIYKVFSLTSVDICSNHKDYEAWFRFSQDSGIVYSDWKPLNNDNIASTKLDKLRFANFEYLFQNKSSNPLVIYDVILNGDFQNVTANYLKSNRYGIKSDCMLAIQKMQKNPNGFFSTYSDTNVAQNVNTANLSYTSGYWNPYQGSNQIVDFYNLLANGANQTVGWTFEYHLTDPDSNGIDRIIHEYTLKHIVDYQKVKCIVPDNKFPVETLISNQFNLDLFDVFELHILKDDFKNAFGITKRPSQDDIIYICDINMLFIVKHAQAFRSVMNASTYYKVILEKYQQQAHVDNQVKESMDRISELTDNTTMESLFGEAIKNESKDIANKVQMTPKTFDKVRHEINPKVVITNELIMIDGIDIVTSAYDLSHSTLLNKTAVDYKFTDQVVTNSDNRSFIFWFNLKNKYKEGKNISTDVIKSYNFSGNADLINNYSTVSGVGYDIYYLGGTLNFKINNTIYRLVGDKLLTNVWYACVINVNQQNQVINLNIYRRDCAVNVILYEPKSYAIEEIDVTDTVTIDDFISQGYKRVDNEELADNVKDFVLVSSTGLTYEPGSFIHDINLSLIGNQIKISNIRVLNDVIPEGEITNILREKILSKESYLILADNAGKKLIATNYFNRNWK